METTTTLRTGFRTVAGTRVRYADSCCVHERAVLLTSPWPESVHAFVPIWAPLAEHARLFAVDLPGFGQSERREELMSARAMGGFLAELVAEIGLGAPHLLAPDVGTSAALFAALTHPERVASVIVGEPVAVVGESVDTIAPDVADEIRQDYLDSYGGDRFSESMRYVSRCGDDLPELSGIDTPVLVVVGTRDKRANAALLDGRLPNSRVVVIDAGHYLWEEAPMDYASAVIDWITEDEG
jgi:pimeloyl-ACP methyl ester carboxylesterase